MCVFVCVKMINNYPIKNGLYFVIGFGTHRIIRKRREKENKVK